MPAHPQHDERQAIVDDVRHSAELEHAEVPADVEQLQQQWIEGAITLEQLRERVDELYPSRGPA
jgi:hypothetical protein